MGVSLFPSLQSLLAKGPAGLGAWLDAHRDDPAAAQAVHWHGLAEAAARTARTEMDLEWAEVADRLYTHWGSTRDASAMESGRRSAMFLRAWMIRQFGPVPGDPVLDLQALARLFEDGLSLSIAEACALAGDWQALGVESIIALRRIKDRLKPFELLDSDLMKEIPRVRDWLAIRHLLP